ncbi:hypothetical protein E2C01_030544 [Portunus trituberculatus]|uniref:Uncharacterized protein n=1 Tax=Portunus trituberculatus TaxID=210409 RepID=A0A5B7ER42_PORTR|nr:hypothetical protein [Portunus trituberculatus]
MYCWKKPEHEGQFLLLLKLTKPSTSVCTQSVRGPWVTEVSGDWREKQSGVNLQCWEWWWYTRNYVNCKGALFISHGNGVGTSEVMRMEQTSLAHIDMCGTQPWLVTQSSQVYQYFGETPGVLPHHPHTILKKYVLCN